LKEQRKSVSVARSANLIAIVRRIASQPRAASSGYADSVMNQKSLTISHKIMMKAAIFRSHNVPLSIEDINAPSAPGTGEVVVDILAAPVLSYTQEVFQAKRPYPVLLPLVPGCGAVARIRELGVDATSLKVGQLVFCDPTVRSRDNVLAPDILLQGWIAPTAGSQILQAHFRNGPFAQQMLLPLENAVSLTGLEHYEPAKLTWLNTLLIAQGGLLAAELQAGQVIAIGGATGHFGSSAVAVALAMGAAKVMATGRNQRVLDRLVEKLGSRVCPVLMTGDREEDTKAIRDRADAPIDCSLDLLGYMPDASPVLPCIMSLRRGGTAVLMGGVDAEVPVPYKYMMRNDLTLRGQYMYPRQAPLLMAGLIQSKLLNLDLFEVDSFPLAEVNQAVEHASTCGAFRLTVLLP
jgi:alcohol dehydrogenase